MHRNDTHTLSELTLVHARHEEGSTESDQDRRLINTGGKSSLKTIQLSWNLEDEKKFASHRGGDSSRKEKQLVSSYKRSWCIQVLHSSMSREVPCREQMIEYCSFSFNISPSSEYSGLISFRIDWLESPDMYTFS